MSRPQLVQRFVSRRAWTNMGWVAFAIVAHACFERQLKPVNPCTTSLEGENIQVNNIDSVDLLMLIDDSSSMAEHQVQIIDQLPRIVQTLASGMRDAAHGGNFTPARSLHIGIVSSDMGLGPITGVPSCASTFGDDGVLFFRPRTAGAGCMADYSSQYPNGIFDFMQGTSDTPAQFATDVSCVAELGTGGCGIEYELEPILKALSPAPGANGGSPVSWTASGYVPPTFAGNTFGHGNDPATNGGFLRADSALAILTVNDEDDSSTANYNIYSDDPMYSSVELNVRPIAYADQLYPISRYVSGFLGLRRTPSLLIYSTITGIPLALSGHTPEEVLADPTMVPQIDPAHGERLIPVCTDTMGGQTAVPGLRMVQVAHGLSMGGATVSVHSICNADFTPAIDDIIDKISHALGGACLGRVLNPDADGNVNCDVLELLPAVESDATVVHCADLPTPDAYTLVRVELAAQADGTDQHRELCRLRQVGRAGAGTVAGWAYDDGNAALGAWSMRPAGCTQRIGLSLVNAVSGAEVQLQCSQTILPGTSDLAPQLGDFCDPSTGNTMGTTPMSCTAGHAVAGFQTALACDSFNRSCQVACHSDADCTGAGLLSYVCDTRTAASVFGDASMIPTGSGITADQAHDFCVNPTCGNRTVAN